MAQIIKLFDYISRYELDAYRYPSQFIRLKKQQWEKVFQAWENNMFHTVMKVSETLDNQREEEDEKSTFIKKFKKGFQR